MVCTILSIPKMNLPSMYDVFLLPQMLSMQWSLIKCLRVFNTLMHDMNSCCLNEHWIFSLDTENLYFTSHELLIKPLPKGSFRNWEKHIHSCNKFQAKPVFGQLPLNHSWPKPTNQSPHRKTRKKCWEVKGCMRQLSQYFFFFFLK